MDDHQQRVLVLLEELMDEPIAPEATLVQIDVDSLTLLEWVFAIEEELGISLSEDRVEAIDMDVPVVRLIEALLA